jgi:hypothetical protein
VAKKIYDLNKIAASLAKSENLAGDLALANANGLPLADTFAVHALVLSNRVLRSTLTDKAQLARLVRLDAPEVVTITIGTPLKSRRS